MTIAPREPSASRGVVVAIAAAARLSMFDSSLDAYDRERLGWRYEELECGTSASLDCSVPEPETVGAALETFLNTGLAWNFNAPGMSNSQVEDRKLYNTTAYSQGNRGHEFTAVLSDAERQAIIEYLKTL